jgi:hypothetical protein
MRTTDLLDLLETVERIRDQLHPGLSTRFLKAVVEAEDRFPEDDASALNLIESALDEYLAELEGAD